MIALQINNWNERKISVQKEIVILEEIHQALSETSKTKLNHALRVIRARPNYSILSNQTMTIRLQLLQMIPLEKNTSA